MGVERDKWKAEFEAGATLPWQCPACHASPLRVVGDSLKDGETRDSKAMRDHDAFEPDLHVRGRFACIVDCVSCGNEIGVAGTYRLVDERYEDAQHGEQGDYVKSYRPSYFTDSPHLVHLPEKTPDDVREELIGSFQLFWSDPVACTNRIRSSVEKLLSAERVVRTTRDGRGKRVFLTLHARIERYMVIRKDVAEKLMAIKWIGNAGSHSTGITVEDALDDYEIMDWVLDHLYAKRHHRAAKLTRAINRRKAPLSRRRGSGR